MEEIDQVEVEILNVNARQKWSARQVKTQQQTRAIQGFNPKFDHTTEALDMRMHLSHSRHKGLIITHGINSAQRQLQLIILFKGISED